jgi:hypothetical protein
MTCSFLKDVELIPSFFGTTLKIFPQRNYPDNAVILSFPQAFKYYLYMIMDPKRDFFKDLKNIGEMQTFPAIQEIRNRMVIENAISKYAQIATNAVSKSKVDAVLASDKMEDAFSIIGDFYWSGIFI